MCVCVYIYIYIYISIYILTSEIKTSFHMSFFLYMQAILFHSSALQTLKDSQAKFLKTELLNFECFYLKAFKIL